MGSVAQAVVEFDESVRAPWRPPLAGTPARRPQLRAVAEPLPSRRAPAADPRLAAGRPGAPVRRPAVRRAPERPAAAPGLRLTRRARRLGAVLGLTVGVALGSWVGSAVAGDEGGLRLAGESSVVVRSGDTLWSIAATVAGEGDDVRAVVAEIRELNGLADASLVPGQVLSLP